MDRCKHIKQCDNEKTETRLGFHIYLLDLLEIVALDILISVLQEGHVELLDFAPAPYALGSR